MKRNNVVRLYFSGYSLVDQTSKAWSTSPLLEAFLKRITRKGERPMVRVEAGASADYTLEFLKYQPAPNPFGNGKVEHICYYRVRHEEWSAVVTVCREALVEMFGRVPKVLGVSAEDQ